jgi:hypothetical protein
MRSSIESALPHVYIVNPPFTKLTGFSTNVSKKLLSPLVLPVAFVDILSTNVYATATIFGGGVSLIFRCAAPTFVADCKVVMSDRRSEASGVALSEGISASLTKTDSRFRRPSFV